MLKSDKVRWYIWGVIPNAGMETMPVTDCSGPQWVIRWARRNIGGHEYIYYSLEKKLNPYQMMRVTRRPRVVDP